jgi:hypothetical protein
MRCYVCHTSVPIDGTLFVAGVEEEEVALCTQCADLTFPGMRSVLSGQSCAGCGVERPSMN